MKQEDYHYIYFGVPLGTFIIGIAVFACKIWRVQVEKGVFASKLPKVTGKDLVFAKDCAICLDEIEDEQPARMVPGCNHGFHIECADHWLFIHRTCPVCRAPIMHDLFNPPETNPC